MGRAKRLSAECVTASRLSVTCSVTECCLKKRSRYESMSVIYPPTALRPRESPTSNQRVEVLSELSRRLTAGDEYSDLEVLV